ncbi:MAG: hypothetical protein LEGION0398_MBIBDBAK_00245 [Legionellaceae bacterium]
MSYIVHLDNFIEIGNRIKFIRKLANIEQQELAKLAQISRVALSYYEKGAGRFKLTYKAAVKITEGLKLKGIICTPEWIITGEGEQPSLLQGININSDKQNSIKEKEIKLFLTHPESVVIEIESDALLPFLKEGDYVGGIWIPSHKLEKEELCIIDIYNKFEARNVISSKQHPDSFDLAFTTFIENEKSPFELKAVKINRFAPIIRFWRK